MFCTELLCAVPFCIIFVTVLKFFLCKMDQFCGCLYSWIVFGCQLMGHSWIKNIEQDDL